MRQLRDDTHLILDGEVRVYRRERSKRWQTAFVIDAHTICIASVGWCCAANTVLAEFWANIAWETQAMLTKIAGQQMKPRNDKAPLNQAMAYRLSFELTNPRGIEA